MKKRKFYFNQHLVVVILSILLVGCSSDDETGESNTVQPRTQITMNIPANGDINWNNVNLVWSEEFNASANLDDIWVFEQKNISNPDIADQLQEYRRENVMLDGGKLRIYATKKDGIYSSAKLSGKYAFKYGRIEFSAKLPEKEKNGLWAKLALIGDGVNVVGWPKAGEIDVMEYFSHIPNTTYINVHNSTYNASNGNLISASNYLETVEERFHAYGILWTDKYIKFYIDTPDNIIYTLNKPASPTEENWPFDKHFYLFIDMVIGGRYAGAQGVDDSLFPAFMELDYMRVYHPK